MSGSTLRAIDVGVNAGLVLASADGGVTEEAHKTAFANNENRANSQSTPSGAVKPTTSTGSSSRRRLTSLSLRSAGYNEVDDVPATRGSGHLHLNKFPTPGSTMHTRSTSSFSSWSVGSLNAAREGNAKVPDIRTIVDLATGRAGRVTAAKVGPSPSGSVGNGTGFTSRSTPPGPHATPVRPAREPPVNSASLLHHRNPSPSNSAGVLVPISPLVIVVAREQAAGLGTKGGATTVSAAAAASGHAETADGKKSSKTATKPTPPRCPVVATPRSRHEQQQRRQQEPHRKANGLQQPGVVPPSSRARRPPFNPYRVAARKASPRNAGNSIRLQRGHQLRRAKNEGTPKARRGQRRAHGEQVGGCSTLASSPSSSSSSSSPSSSSSSPGSCGKTYTVEWIWPATRVGNWSPRVVARRQRTGLGAKTVAKGPPSPSRTRSSPSPRPSGSRPPMDFGVQAWSRNTAGLGARDGSGSGWTNPRHYSEERDDPVSRTPVSGDTTAARAQREPTQSFSTRPGVETAVAAGRVAAGGDGVAPVRETFQPNGRGGWVRPPPRPLDTERRTARAPLAASPMPSTSVGGETNASPEEDICDLAPLSMTRRRVSARGGASTTTAGAPSSGNNKANHRMAAATSRRWWKAVVRKLFDGRGEAPPPPLPPSSPPPVAATQEDNDSSFLNPFSPNSSRRFSTCSTQAGAGDGSVGGFSSGYDSGVDGGGGFGGGGAAAAASRITRHFEERVIGCVFGEEDSAAGDDDDDDVDDDEEEEEEKDDEVEVARGEELGREDQGEDEGQQVEELESGSRPSPFPSRSSPHTCRLVPDNVWPLPAAVDGQTADGIDGCGGDGLTPDPATSAAQPTSEGMLALTKAAVAASDPESTRTSSTCSTTSSRSAVAIANASAATSAAASAAAAAAIAGQASLAAHVAAATAKQVRDAFRFVGVDTAAGTRGSDHNYSSSSDAE